VLPDADNGHPGSGNVLPEADNGLPEGDNGLLINSLCHYDPAQELKTN